MSTESYNTDDIVNDLEEKADTLTGCIEVLRSYSRLGEDELGHEDEVETLSRYLESLEPEIEGVQRLRKTLENLVYEDIFKGDFYKDVIEDGYLKSIEDEEEIPVQDSREVEYTDFHREALGNHGVQHGL